MAFDEGDEIMARWPGTSLYFKAKVNFVRDDDNEYDVVYEDGTVFTIKAKDVKKRSIADDKSAKKATPSRSRFVRCILYAILTPFAGIAQHFPFWAKRDFHLQRCYSYQKESSRGWARQVL